MNRCLHRSTTTRVSFTWNLRLHRLSYLQVPTTRNIPIVAIHGRGPNGIRPCLDCDASDSPGTFPAGAPRTPEGKDPVNAQQSQSPRSGVRFCGVSFCCSSGRMIWTLSSEIHLPKEFARRSDPNPINSFSTSPSRYRRTDFATTPSLCRKIRSMYPSSDPSIRPLVKAPQLIIQAGPATRATIGRRHPGLSSS